MLKIDKDREFLLNAGVEAALTLFGALAAFLAGSLKSPLFIKFDLWILTFCSLLEGILIIISSQTSSIWVAYLMYITVGILYQFMITIASALVAAQLADDSFALIFGINTLISVLMQSILTAVLITWIELDTRDQFLAYGIYFIVLAGIFLVTAILKALKTSF